MSSTGEAGTQLVIRRTFKATRQRVFDAWTRPEHLQRWWYAHPGWSASLAEVDLETGGKYRLGMFDPNTNQTFICYGEFKEIVIPERLVYTWSWEPPAMDVGETLVTVEFVEKGDSTELILTHERFPSAEAAAKHNEGWSGCIGVLKTHVESESE